MSETHRKEALIEAWRILHMAALSLYLDPVAVWRMVNHAEQYIDEQIREMLKEGK